MLSADRCDMARIDVHRRREVCLGRRPAEGRARRRCCLDVPAQDRKLSVKNNDDLVLVFVDMQRWPDSTDPPISLAGLGGCLRSHRNSLGFLES